MFSNVMSMDRSGAGGAVPDLRAINRLGAALAELPAPWKVLRNRRARGVDGPPWVKYIAFHPEKGIALVDLLPAQPDAAIAPLDEFLTRTGFAAFSQADPPIVAAALAERDITGIGDCLADAFAGASRCGITTANWIDAVIELLMSTEGLLLAPLEPAAKARSGIRHSPSKDEGAAAPAPAPAPRPALASEEPEPEERVLSSEPLPSGESNPPGEPRLKLSGETQPVWHADHPNGSAPRTAPVRHYAPWMIAASLSAAVGAVMLYPHPLALLRRAPPPETTVPPQTQDLAFPPPANSPLPGEETYATPRSAAIPTRPLPRTGVPARDSAAAEPHAAAVPSTPESVIPPPDNVAASTPPSPRRSTPSHQRRAEEAQATPSAGHQGAEHRTRNAGRPEPPASEEIVVVDGIAYVKGREPRSLGTVSVPLPEAGQGPAVAPDK
jgi:hypothetical protein